MTERIEAPPISNAMSSTALMPAGVETDSTTRPRNRKGGNSKNASSTYLALGEAPDTSRGASPMPSPRLSAGRLASSGRSSPSNAFGKGLLEGSWAPSWSSVQGLASSIMGGGEAGYVSDHSRPSSRGGSKPRPKSMWTSLGGGGAGSSNRKLPESWGPPPAKSSRSIVEDIGSGSIAERDAALRAMKTASVLESHEGVNGGLDVSGKFKRRNSNDGNAASAKSPVDEGQLVYLHHVQPSDTYAGIILRYNCQENAFRKANGLWARDDIQMLKYLKIPVDACQIKGRPCEAPNSYAKKVDHLATTPQPESHFESGALGSTTQNMQDDFFASRDGQSRSLLESDHTWAHVRWVKLDSMDEPVEIVRFPRKAMGFFPPRRKASIRTASAMSSPRTSLDLSRAAVSTENGPTASNSPTSVASRRQSSLNTRPNLGSFATSSSTGRSRTSSLGPADKVPSWMRRPGGVGSMSRNVRVPGPAKDSLNTWVNRRLPGFNIDNLPSMSVMGSESAAWGFKGNMDDEAAGIVDRHFGEGQEIPLDSGQGTGLEQAANAIETWVRSTLSKRPGTPRLGSYRRPQDEDVDLIELAAAHSDDGRPATPVMNIPQPRLNGTGDDLVQRAGYGSVSSSKGKKAD